MSDGLDQPCPSGHGLRDAEGTRALTDTAELRFLRRLMLTFSLRQATSSSNRVDSVFSAEHEQKCYKVELDTDAFK